MRTKRTVGILTTLMIVLAVAAPGSAEVKSRRDVRGDVMHYNYINDRTAPNPALVGVDIRSVTADFTADYLFITTRFVDLQGPESETRMSYTLNTDTTSEPNYRVIVLAGTEPFIAPRGVWMQKDVKWGAPGPWKRCGGLRRSYNYTANTVRVRIPSTCIDSPAAVDVQPRSLVEWNETNRGLDYAYDFAAANGMTYGFRVSRG